MVGAARAARTAQTAPSPARALRQLRRPRWLDTRGLFGFFILVTATGASLAFWSASSVDTQAVLVAARDVPAGTRLTAADVTVAHVRLGDAIYRTAIPASEQADTIGRQLSQPLVAHQLLARAHVAGPGPTTLGPHQLAMTIPVSADSAAGGQLRPGDAVRVLATSASLAAGRAEPHTAVVLPRATVYGVGYEERTAVVATAAGGARVDADSGGDGRGRAARITSVTLVVNQDQALELARARWNGELDVMLLPPGS